VTEELSEVLRSVPTLRVLVAGRRPRHVRGERVVVVGPLGERPASGLDEPTSDADPAAMLLAHGAHAAGYALQPDAWHQPTVSAICDVLDRVPLAIELAARRLSVLSLDELFDRLRSRPLREVLDGGRRAVDASSSGVFGSMLESTFAALSSAEQVALEQLAHFEDWATLDEITEALPTAQPDAGVDALSGLVDAHVVEIDLTGEAGLYRVRRAFRELVRERPARRPEIASTAEPATFDALRRFAEDAVRGLLVCLADGSHPSPRHTAIGRRARDLRSAATWLLSSAHGHDPGAIVVALSMHDAERGDLTLDRPLLSAALRAIEADEAADPTVAVLLRGLLLYVDVEAANPTTNTGALAAALDDAVKAAADSGDPYVRLMMLRYSVASARTIGHLDQAERHATEAIEFATTAGFAGALAEFELLAGMIAHVTRRFDDAAALGARAHFRGRRLGNPLIAAQAGILLNQLPRATTNLPVVVPSAAELDGLFDGTEGGGRSSIAVRYGIAQMSIVDDDLRLAAHNTSEALRTSRAIGLLAGAGSGVALTIALAARSGKPALAAALHGALADNFDVVAHSIPPRQRAALDRTIEAVRHDLGDEAFDNETRLGAGWSWAHTLDQAQRFVDDLAVPPKDSPHDAGLTEERHPLTVRERNVLALLALGQSNKEIATTLGTAPKTVMHHTCNIYRKLGVRGRGEAAAWAHRQGLLDPAG
jgi:DNA-binding CsgD family transcriptional regulator